MSTPNDSPANGQGESPAQPVFFDPSRKRWPRMRLGMVILGLTLSLLLGALVLSILVSPILPALSLPSASIVPHGAHMAPPVPTLSTERALTRRERALRDTEAKLMQEKERSLRHLLTQFPKTNRIPNDQPLSLIHI